MDRKTRGLIEEAFDSIKEIDILDRVGWVLREYVVESPADLALGYVLGSCMSAARDIAWRMKVLKKSDEDYQKWKKEYEKKYGIKYVEPDVGDVKRRLTYLTKKETKQIRDILRRRITDYRMQIFGELNR